MLHSSGVFVVIDHDDSPEGAAFLHALGDLKQRRAVCVVRPGGRDQLQPLAREVLTALGKRHDREGSARDASDDWRRAIAWVAAEDVDDLIVVRAQLLSRRRWEALIAAAAISGCRLWLLVQGRRLSRSERETVRDWPCRVLPFDDFAARWPGAGTLLPSAPAAEGTTFPQPPDSDFPVFRSDCRELLEPSEFAVIDTEMCETVRTTETWFARVGVVDEAGFSDFLRSLLSDAQNAHQAFVRLRAAQVAGFKAGWLIKVDTERFVLTSEASRQARVDRALADALRTYTNTKHAAAALLTALCHLSPEALSKLTIGAATDGTAVELAPARIAVPSFAQAILRAHLYQRALAGGGPSNPLFASDEGPTSGRPMTPNALRRALKAVARDTGNRLWAEYHTGDQLSQRRWLSRRGVSVQCL
jgi:hypothetical protein